MQFTYTVCSPKTSTQRFDHVMQKYEPIRSEKASAASDWPIGERRTLPSSSCDSCQSYDWPTNGVRSQKSSVCQELTWKRDFNVETVGPLWLPHYFINFSTKEKRFQRLLRIIKRMLCSGKLRVELALIPSWGNNVSREREQYYNTNLMLFLLWSTVNVCFSL